jgi:acetolactate synthase-1/2/3 large subunit
VTIGKSIVEALRKEKVRFLFGMPGADSRKMLYDTLYDEPEIKHVQVRHTQSAPFMAMASSRLTGQPTVCTGTSGPGVMNMVVGVAEAHSICAPVMAVVPCISMIQDGRGAGHEVDSLSVYKPITKWAVRVEVAEKIPWCLRRAFSISCNGKPGPVYVEFPGDLDEAAVIPRYVPSTRPIRTAGDPERVREAADLITKSQTPVIISGGGALSSGAFKEVPMLAEILFAPIFTTPTGRGIVSEDHPLAVGLTGVYRNEIADNVYANADLLISIGFRFELLETMKFNWLPKSAKLIQIDIDPFEIGKHFLADVAIVGDAKLVLQQIIDVVREKTKRGPFTEMPRVKELVKAKQDYESAIDSELAGVVPVSAARVVKELGKIFGKNTILANENGAVDIWSYIFPYYKVLDVGPCVGAFDQLNCMGAGVASAIGAKITVPSKKVVCTTGDGAFQMLMHELPVTAQYNAPVTFVIFNNFALGWTKYGQKVLFKERFIDTDFKTVPDYVKFAESCKCYGERIEKPDQIASSLKNALRANGEGKSAVLDIVLPPNWWDWQPKSWIEWAHTRVKV